MSAIFCDSANCQWSTAAAHWGCVGPALSDDLLHAPAVETTIAQAKSFYFIGPVCIKFRVPWRMPSPILRRQGLSVTNVCYCCEHMAELYREAPAAATLSPNKKHCYACANILDVRAEICPQCGVRQPVMPGALAVTGPTSLAISSKNRQTAGIFALILGGIGIHKFYLGQVGMGIVYLLFCWTAIPALIGFIEGIILLTMTDEAFAQKHPG